MFLAAWGCGVEGGVDGMGTRGGQQPCEGYSSGAYEVRAVTVHVICVECIKLNMCL